MAETMHFEGACPFLTCLETGPHDHEICPECEAVRYGNLYCETCRSQWPDVSDDFKKAIKEAIEANAEAA